MRISVDVELCEANGVCVGMAPDIFELRDNDELLINDANDIPDTRRRELLEVTGSCPRGALSVSDE